MPNNDEDIIIDEGVIEEDTIPGDVSPEPVPEEEIVVISSVALYYGTNDETEIPNTTTTPWQATVPTGYDYVWTVSKKTYSDDSVAWSVPVIYEEERPVIPDVDPADEGDEEEYIPSEDFDDEGKTDGSEAKDLGSTGELGTSDMGDGSSETTSTIIDDLVANDYRFSTSYRVSGTVWTFNATLYYAGADITSTVPPTDFTWYKKTESGRTLLGTGPTLTVNTDQFNLGGSVVGVYSNEDNIELTGTTVTFNSADYLGVRSLQTGINSIPQTFNGFNKPWAGGTEKNLLPLRLVDLQYLNDGGTWTENAYTINGVTFTAVSNAGGNMTGIAVSGALSEAEEARFKLCNFTTAAPEEGAVSVSYHLSGGISGAVLIELYNKVDGDIDISDEGSGATLTTEEPTEVTMDIVVSGAIPSSTVIQPMLQIDDGGTLDTTFMPYENNCPIEGWNGVTVTHSGGSTSTSYTASFESVGPIYGGMYDIVSGQLFVTKENITSYSGEELNGPWVSSLDVYSADGEPTNGAQVVHLLTTPYEYQLTGQPVSILNGANTIQSNVGDITVTLIPAGDT